MESLRREVKALSKASSEKETEDPETEDLETEETEETEARGDKTPPEGVKKNSLDFREQGRFFCSLRLQILK